MHTLEKCREYKRANREKVAASEQRYRATAHAKRLRRNARILAAYGISAGEYDTLLAAQGGVCAVCKSQQPSGRLGVRWFAVDHCHKTGRVRGLLYLRCNG